MGISGNMLEIGAYHGRSAAVLANHLNLGEYLVICDIFEEGDSAVYGDTITPKEVTANILSVNPGLSAGVIRIFKGDSSKLSFGPEDRFRFIHIDGGHSYKECLLDLRICVEHVINSGIIVVDDFMHPDWPEVTNAINDFLNERKDIRIIADLNRSNVIGRKLYLLRNF
jgi:predicted O-methyltransferase YrrM